MISFTEKANVSFKFYIKKLCNNCIDKNNNFYFKLNIPLVKPLNNVYRILLNNILVLFVFTLVKTCDWSVF